MKIQKIIKSLILALTIVTIFSGLTAVAAQEFDTGYITNYFNVDISVSENNTYTVTETINVDFLQPRHGIYRYLPVCGTAHIASEDKGSEQIKYRAQISNISVLSSEDGKNFSPAENVIENDSLYKTIKIGSEDQTISGKHTYQIKYDYRLYDDNNEKFDLLYFNVVPHDWSTSISSSSINITMPKSFSAESVSFIGGTAGESTEAAVTKQVDAESRTITAGTTKNLMFGEGITVLAFLDEGYFTNELTYLPQHIILILSIIIPALIAAVLFFIFGKDTKMVTPVEFTPPNGLTPAEVGYIADGYADKNDIISLIIYWADKGYINIIEKEDKSITLQKIRDLPKSAKNFEKTFFGELFRQSSVQQFDKIENEKMLTALTTSAKQLSETYNKNNKIFTVSSLVSRAIAAVLTVIPLAAAVFIGSYIACRNDFYFAFIPVFLICAGAFMLGSGIDYFYTQKKLNIRSKIGIGFLIYIVGAVVYVIIGNINDIDSRYLVLSLVSNMISVAAAMFMRKRTDFGSDISGRIIGFKDFLERAEKDKIDMLCEQNPQYFYNILPYAYVLGITDTFAKKFEHINLSPPAWYTPYDRSSFYSAYNVLMFSHIFGRNMSFVQSKINVPASPAGSGGGFSGSGFGGGFSGGGFGGGGGGSW